jgi:Zn-dependent protease with chaperone function
MGIPEPEFYLQMDPNPNAWTFGDTRIYITVTSSLVEMMSDKELDAIIAHECGHILCQHVLYQTLANAIFSFGDAIADSFVGMIGNVAMKPIRQALMLWSRASELTADRVACIISPVTTLSRVLARVDMIPKNIVETMDFNAWAKQGEDFEELTNGTAWNKIVHFMADYDADHPYTPVRVYEAMKWEQTDTCQWSRSNPVKFEFPEEIEAAKKAELAAKKAEEKSDSSWSLPKIPKNVDVNSVITKFKGFKK